MYIIYIIPSPRKNRTTLIFRQQRRIQFFQLFTNSFSVNFSVFHCNFSFLIPMCLCRPHTLTRNYTIHKHKAGRITIILNLRQCKPCVVQMTLLIVYSVNYNKVVLNNSNLDNQNFFLSPWKFLYTQALSVVISRG